ncbi:MAG: PAS domain-containing protein [Verrucomicrobiales bacterium]|nr:PAS domain-containing protein [Verrucomicrobiales bacterium]
MRKQLAAGFLQNIPIKRKLTLITMLTSGVALLLTCAAFVAYEQVTFRHSMELDLQVLTDIFDDNVTPGLAFNDPKSIEQVLNSLDAHPALIAAAVYDNQGAVVAKHRRANLTADFRVPAPRATGTQFHHDRLESFREVFLAGERIGTIYIASDLSQLHARFWRYGIIVTAVLAVSALVAFVLSAKLQHIISGPIIHLATVAANVATDKNYSVRALKQGEDELGRLIDAFNEMLNQIQSRDSAVREARDNLEERVQARTQELVEEVMERQRAEETLAQQAKLAVLGAEVGVALTRQENLPAMLNECAESVVKHLEAAFARIWTLNAEENVLELRASAGMYTHLDGPHGRVPVGKFKIGLIAEERKPHLTNSVVGDPRVGDQEWARREGMVAFAGYPLIVAGRVVGVMAMFARHELSENTLRELASIADGIGLGIVRQETEEALRNSELKFRQFAENIREVFWMTTPNMDEIIYVSPAYQRVWGRSTESLYERPLGWVEAILPEDRSVVLKACQELAGTRPNFDIEYRIQRPDGTIRWIRDRGVQVLDNRGQVYRTAGVASDITERKEAEASMEAMHKQLLETSRQAGMAEVATGVLHNVGNVLNSVNVSATLVADNMKKSKVANLSKAMALLGEHAADLANFLTNDPKGKQLPGYLRQLAEHLLKDQRDAIAELESLRKNIEHIKDIVAMQQSYAKVSGLTEIVQVTDLVEDTLRLNAGALTRHGVEVVRQFDQVPPINVEKHKVLQILVNLVRNAKYACDDSGRPDKRLIVRVTNGQARLKISVIDNGIGITPENLTRIFNHGFTTRKDGHGFGLHSGALAAKEMGGSLNAQSEGPGQGAMFTLELPCTTT